MSKHASEHDLKLFRNWTRCPDDFVATEPSDAIQVYAKLFSIGVHVEAWRLLEYLRGTRPLTAEDYEKVQVAYMCEFSPDRAAAREKYR